jgi:hypothetical protein
VASGTGEPPLLFVHGQRGLVSEQVPLELVGEPSEEGGGGGGGKDH